DKMDLHEAGFVSVPDLSYRGFRSSLTYDGAYGVLNQPRYRQIDKSEAYSASHGKDLAELATFFTFSAMGNTMNNAEKAIPRVKEIFSVLQFNKPLKFPGEIDSEKAQRGSQIFSQSCSKCHGTYSAGIDNPELLSFPNKLVSTDLIGTDALRWQNVTKGTSEFSKAQPIGRHVDAGNTLGGYVAPILSGLWYTAPYLHNGSVPTLWQLMNPELRPKKFMLGGHALDLQDIGIRGQLNEKNEYVYPSDYTPWSYPTMYDTSEDGRSNKGHEKPFANLSQEQKRDLIEYLKLL
ncbi:MAG TPA: cytochrome c, partial [Bdellovibrio sp.]|nr:cytochrome c [Bdellovibrio sp.]